MTDDFDKRLLNCFARVSQFRKRDILHYSFLFIKNILFVGNSSARLRRGEYWLWVLMGVSSHCS